MKRVTSLITLWVLSVAVLLPGVAGAQSAKPGNDIQTQLKSIQEQLKIIQDQLANRPPAWSRQLRASERFVVLAEFNNEAVLDKETGLVWEQTPSRDSYDWFVAHTNCSSSTVGNRKGWRLPTHQELSSLVEPSVAPPGPFLPAGHPFSNVQSRFYWSATTSASGSRFAIIESFNDVVYNGRVYADKLDTSISAWCVRGGQGVDPQ